MSINLQIDISSLETLVVNQLQAVLNTTCLPIQDTTFVDSIDVQSISHSIQLTGVTFAVTTKVLLVTQAALDATIGFNSIPEADAFTFVINLRLAANTLSTDDPDLALTCISIDAPNAEFQLIAHALVSQLGNSGSLGAFSLSTLLNIFAIQNLGPDDIFFEVVAPGILLVWFGTSPTPSVNHVRTFGLQWCVVVQSNAIEDLVKNTILAGLQPRFDKNNVRLGEVEVHWAPRGLGAPTIPTPFLTATLVGKGKYLIIPYEVDANFRLDLYFEGLSLVMSVFWFLSATVQDVLDPFLPGAGAVAQTIADAKVDSIQKSFDPTVVGGARVDDTHFRIIKSLPSLSLKTAKLAWNSCIGLADGMILGGRVDPGTAPSAGHTEFYTTQFPNQYSSVVSCNDPDKILSTTIIASSYSGDFSIGVLCAIDVVSPSSVGVALKNYVFSDTPLEQPTFGVKIYADLPGSVAFSIAATREPLVIRVRTGRGIRMVDFGVPPMPQYDSAGKLANTEITQTTDCLPPGGNARKIPLSIQANRWRLDPPMNWIDTVDHVAAFESALITVNIKVGEAVFFKQPQGGGTTVIHGGMSGIATVPTLVALRSYDEGACLESSSRSCLTGITKVSKIFRRVATLHTKGALSHRLVEQGRNVKILTSYRDEVEETEIDTMGVVSPVVKCMLDGSATKTSEGRGETGTQSVMPGCVALHAVPGFESESTSIARLDDGFFRVVLRDKQGNYQAVGTVPRWIESLTVLGSWATSNAQKDYITVFSVHQTSPKACKCARQAEI